MEKDYQKWLWQNRPGWYLLTDDDLDKLFSEWWDELQREKEKEENEHSMKERGQKQS